MALTVLTPRKILHYHEDSREVRSYISIRRHLKYVKNTELLHYNRFSVVNHNFTNSSF